MLDHYTTIPTLNIHLFIREEENVMKIARDVIIGDICTVDNKPAIDSVLVNLFNTLGINQRDPRFRNFIIQGTQIFCIDYEFMAMGEATAELSRDGGPVALY
eukprot:TRINITY_DN8920_c0_g1_i1.p1 TRINITY_DN8920_c0_g1~~TRINITY_DN8920_c0_g1_i1.p1  ORF type:complete len:116 (-),score=21.53 TRINITY_DN8920_c0_g1_i1:163-468(-)